MEQFTKCQRPPGPAALKRPVLKSKSPAGSSKTATTPGALHRVLRGGVRAVLLPRGLQGIGRDCCLSIVTTCSMFNQFVVLNIQRLTLQNIESRCLRDTFVCRLYAVALKHVRGHGPWPRDSPRLQAARGRRGAGRHPGLSARDGLGLNAFIDLLRNSLQCS